MCIFFNSGINSSIIFENTHFLLGTHLNSLIICCLSSDDIYIFVIIIIIRFFFETLVILSAILLPIKSPVASAVLSIALFGAPFIASAVDFLALSRSFWTYLLVKLLPHFLRRTKNHVLFHTFYLLVQLNISFLYVIFI